MFLTDFLEPPTKFSARNAEALYWQSFASQHGQNFGLRGSDECVYADDPSQHIDADDAVTAALKQSAYFQSIDRLQVDLEDSRIASTKVDDFDRRLHRSVESLPRQCVPSETAVMEAAFYLIKEGVWNIPDMGRVNVKQARALLWNAAWLQEHMNSIWRDEGALPRHIQPSKSTFLDDLSWLSWGLVELATRQC